MFLAYASARGHALIDRELYVPESWTADRDRCRAAGIPDEVEFATKPRQVIAMLERTVAAGVPFGWFTADEAYGHAGYLRDWLEDHDVFYVMATRCDHQLTTRAERVDRADVLIAGFPARACQRLSVGAGAHGPREYDWARWPIDGRIASSAAQESALRDVGGWAEHDLESEQILGPNPEPERCRRRGVHYRSRSFTFAGSTPRVAPMSCRGDAVVRALIAVFVPTRMLSLTNAARTTRRQNPEPGT